MSQVHAAKLSRVLDIFREAKIDALLDLIRRAAAQPNPDFREIAAAIEDDWFPLLSITPTGKVEVHLK